MPQGTQIEHDFEGKGSFDAEGKSFVLGTAYPPAEGLAQINMSTIATPKIPAAGMPGAMPAPQQGEEEEEEGAEEALKEHLAALFANLNLSEDFVEKAKTIFVAAVNEKAREIGTQLSEHYQVEYSNALQTTVSELTEKVDDYLTYVVEEWVDQNKLQVERGIKIELAENFIFGLKKLFESNFIDVPDEKYDVLDELYTQIEESNNELNKAINENVKLRKNLLESHAINIFAQETHGLAATQVEKLASLAEGLDYENPEQFRNKLQILKESYFAAPQQPAIQAPSFRQQPRVLDILDTSSEPETLTEGVMNVYSRALSRHLKK
jgi:hypothetical protein